MKRFFYRLSENFLLIFIFWLPWQTAWIFAEKNLNGYKWQFGTMALYGSEIVLWLIAILGIIFLIRRKKIEVKKNLPSLLRWLSGSKSWQFQDFFKKLFHRFGVNIQRSCLILSVYLFLLWSGLSVFWARDHFLAFYSWFRLIEGVLVFFLILAFNFNRLKIIWAIILAGLAQSVLAVWQFFNQAVYGSKWLGIAEHWPQIPGTFVVEIDGFRWLRAYGSFTHPNILGGFLAVCFFCGLFVYLKYATGWQKVFLSAVLVFNVAGLFFSFSRSAWLAWIGGMVFYIILEIFYRRKMPRDFWRLAFYVVLTMILLIGFYRPLVETRLSGETRLEERSIKQRQSANSEALDAIKNSFWFGVGAGHYTDYLYQRNSQLPGWAYQPVHNWYLLIWAELGVIGFLLFTFLFLAVLTYLFKQKKLTVFLPVLVLLLIGLFDHYLWSQYFGLIWWWAVLGLAIDS